MLSYFLANLKLEDNAHIARRFITRMHYIPVSLLFKQVNVMDTVGCGDSFVAAIAFGFIHKMPLVYTLTIANAVGAATAMGCGAGRNVATLKQVMELVKGSILNEDDKFWEDLLKAHLDAEKITLLTKVVVNGNSNPIQLASLQKVVSELIPKLECAQRKQVEMQVGFHKT